MIIARAASGTRRRLGWRETRRLRRVAAAVERCEAIWEVLRGSKRPPPTEEGVRNAIETEPDFASYLQSHNDARVAWAHAKGDVAYLHRLRDRGWQPPTETIANGVTSLMKLLLVPIVLISMTAILGNAVGTALQFASFRRQRDFDARLEVLRQGQREAAAFYTAIEVLYVSTASNELQGIDAYDYAAYSQQRARLAQIGVASQGFDHTGEVNKAVHHGTTVLQQYVECLRARKGTPAPAEGESCSERHRLLDMAKHVGDAHEKAILDLLTQSSTPGPKLSDLLPWNSSP